MKPRIPKELVADPMGSWEQHTLGTAAVNYEAGINESGPGSSVGIVTGYGVGGTGIESRWQRDFPHLSKPDLEPTQPPVQWVPGLSRG